MGGFNRFCGFSCIQALQVVSLDGWQQVMWHTQDAAGDYTWIYFAVLLLLGNIFLVSVSVHILFDLFSL